MDVERETFGDDLQDKLQDELQDEWQEELLQLIELIDSSDIPNNLNELFLKRYLCCTKGNVQEAFRMLKVAFKIRTNNPNLFADREGIIEQSKDVINMVLMRNRCYNNLEYTYYKVLDPDPDKLYIDDLIKAFWVIMDFRLINPEYPKMASGSVAIIDCKGATFRHVLRFGFSTLRVHFNYFMNAQPVKATKMHLINCPSFINTALKLFKPVLPAQIYECMHLHTNYKETLYNFIPKDVVPLEYGGYADSIEDTRDHWLKVINSHGNYLYDDNKWRLMEKDVNDNTGKDKN